jgi:hypothetical protein
MKFKPLDYPYQICGWANYSQEANKIKTENNITTDSYRVTNYQYTLVLDKTGYKSSYIDIGDKLFFVTEEKAKTWFTKLVQNYIENLEPIVKI